MANNLVVAVAVVVVVVLFSSPWAGGSLARTFCLSSKQIKHQINV